MNHPVNESHANGTPSRRRPVSIALLMVRITSMKSLLPLGPAIITTTVLVPVMLVA